MAHRSLHAVPLRAVRLPDAPDLPSGDDASPVVWFVAAPALDTKAAGRAWRSRFREWITRRSTESIVALLTTPEDAAHLAGGHLNARVMLWVALRTAGDAIAAKRTHLPRRHAALLVLSRSKEPLRHTKTRIAYTICPACDRTTKDYGGKKHTYDPFGTLMSDVWRDIVWDPSAPDAVVGRLRDLFGLAPWTRLHHVVVTPPAARLARDAGCLGPRPPVAGADAAPLGQARLLTGDCIELLNAMPPDSIDFAFADPPYNIDKKYDAWDDAMDSREYFAWCDRWLDAMLRVLKPGRTLAVLNIPQWTARHFAFLANRARFQDWIAWEGLSLPVRMIMPAHYAIACFTKGAPKPIPGLVRKRHARLDAEALSALRDNFCGRADCVRTRRALRVADREACSDLWWDIHRLKHNSRRVDHPCQLPPMLMRRLIALYTNPGEMVLDPFNGAGTTTLCAVLHGRNAIGIDLSQPYTDLAGARHDELARGADPFSRRDAVPRSKNSRVRRIGSTEYAVPKKRLQLEVREIARRIGHIPSRDEVARLSTFPIRYFDDYFVSWGEVCAAARHAGMDDRSRRSGRVAQTSQASLWEASVGAT